MKLKNLLKIVQKVKDQVNEEMNEDKALLAALKEDTEHFSDSEKKDILDYVQNHGWDVESAISLFYTKKLKNKAMNDTISELFPEIAKEL